MVRDGRQRFIPMISLDCCNNGRRSPNLITQVSMRCGCAVDGVFRWFSIRREPLHDQAGALLRWYGTATDIEDRKRAEDLAAGEKRLLEMVTSGHSMQGILEALCQFVESMASGCYCSVVLRSEE